MINNQSEHIRVKGHIGTWYVIDSANYEEKAVYLLEHETFGDMAACVIVDKEGKLLLDDIWNGFEDYKYFMGI